MEILAIMMIFSDIGKPIQFEPFPTVQACEEAKGAILSYYEEQGWWKAPKMWCIPVKPIDGKENT